MATESLPKIRIVDIAEETPGGRIGVAFVWETKADSWAFEKLSKRFRTPQVYANFLAWMAQQIFQAMRSMPKPWPSRVPSAERAEEKWLMSFPVGLEPGPTGGSVILYRSQGSTNGLFGLGRR